MPKLLKAKRLLIFCGLFLTCCAPFAQTVKLGLATYYLQPQFGDPAPPLAPFRSPAEQKLAAPTNQWYSGLIFNAKPDTIFAQPLSVRPVQQGLEIAQPTIQVVPTERKDVEIQYLPVEPLVVAAVGGSGLPAALDSHSDWSIRIALGETANRMYATVGHGSPYVYLEFAGTDARLQLPAHGSANVNGADPRILQVGVNALHYAVFGPTGVQWEQAGTSWIAHLPPGKKYMSIAALPDNSAETFKLLAQHAYAFVRTTKVDWHFDTQHSTVETQFHAETQVMEGSERLPLLGLYPHQWWNNPAVSDKLGPAFDTVRGPIKLLAADSFNTKLVYHGFVPFWPKLKDSPQSDTLMDLMKTDVRNARRMMLEVGTGPYWQGKGLQRISQLLNVVEQQGDQAAAEQLLGLMKSRIESWYNGDSAKTYFAYHKSLGTVSAYPEEYFAVAQMNDHHFHYGYWIHAMADIALRDPSWAANDKWGGLTSLLVRDVATSERGSSEFPFLRNFDPYEGHSWASGIAMGPFGNNQESSSEAINAWAGLILWAEVRGDTALRDLGVYLYTTEIQSVNQYWFDLNHQVFAPEYKNVETSMLFGAKYAHNTWWTDEPREIKGINLLPITTASTYLGQDADFVKRNLERLEPEMATYATRGGKRADPPDIWQDIFAEYLALAEPEKALSTWQRWGSFELGDTRSHALHWMLSLQQWGTPDFQTTADTTLYAVFHNKNGHKVHMAYNAGATVLEAHFSDGSALTVKPHSLAYDQ